APGVPGGAPVNGATDLPSTPGTEAAAETTSCTLSARATTTVGVPEPAGKCSPITFCPTTESWVVVKDLSIGIPLGLSRTRPIDMPSRTTVVTTQTQRERRPTIRDTRPQNPYSSAGSELWCGRN